MFCYIEYAHTWVRLACAQLFGLYFSRWDVKALVDAALTQQTRDVTASPPPDDGDSDGSGGSGDDTPSTKRRKRSDDSTRPSRDYLCAGFNQKVSFVTICHARVHVSNVLLRMLVTHLVSYHCSCAGYIRYRVCVSAVFALRCVFDLTHPEEH